jgi:hypothetical protein
VISCLQLTDVPKTKWVAFAVQCMDVYPAAVWESTAKRLRVKGKDPDKWSVFVHAMRKVYDAGDKVAKARSKLARVYQGGDSLERYIERVISLFADVETSYEMSELDKVHIFRKGLKSRLQEASAINTVRGRPFQNLDELITFLTRLDAHSFSARDVQGLKNPADEEDQDSLRPKKKAKVGRQVWQGPSFGMAHAGGGTPVFGVVHGSAPAQMTYPTPPVYPTQVQAPPGPVMLAPFVAPYHAPHVFAGAHAPGYMPVKRDGPASHVQCYNCNEFGHVQRHCPQRVAEMTHVVPQAHATSQDGGRGRGRGRFGTRGRGRGRGRGRH